MNQSQGLYQQYTDKMQRIADIRNASAVLQWDQETYLPVNGAHYRGRQISTLTEISHQLFGEEELGNILKKLLQQKDMPPQQYRNVAITFEDYTKNKKYSSDFVRDLSRQTQKTFHAWISARKQNTFKIFEQDLDQLIRLKKQETEILGYEHHCYNALLDEFEKGCTVGQLDKTFSGLMPVLTSLLQRILLQPTPNNQFLNQNFPKKQQWDWGLALIGKLHFDFNAGRQDISEHPFSTSFNARDVRITTRIDEREFSNMTWSCLHETGHALYEQGLPYEQYGLPLGEACSYSIHESQSRLWENNVGRSKKFWKHNYPSLQNYFPEQFKNIKLDDFYNGINKVQPSFVRTEADEITYHFHVFIRYELEKKIFKNELQTKDIPAYWNEQYRKLLNLQIPDDNRGCLQDVHWSHGSFGYFPTYSLGSFYAAQFFAAAQQKIEGLDTKIEEGSLLPLLEWLRLNIHSQGKFLISEDLCRQVSGKPLDIQFFVNYLLHKYGSIYNL
ncbi:MAG: carboxypeptidase M32 [Flavisolibacter sp.]